MSSSWFSSIMSVSKKKTERVTVTEASDTSVTEDEGFTIVQPQTPYPPAPLYPSVPQPSSMQPLPYPIMTNHLQNHTNSPSHVAKPYHLLDSIPFVLSPKLETSMASHDLPDVENIRRSIVQLTADITDSWFDYDFKLERNVLKELSHNNRN